MADEPVIAPDQLKPGHRTAARVGGVLVIISLLLMTQANHEGHVEDLFLVAVAATIAAILIGDAVLRHYGINR